MASHKATVKPERSGGFSGGDSQILGYSSAPLREGFGGKVGKCSGLRASLRPMMIPTDFFAWILGLGDVVLHCENDHQKPSLLSPGWNVGKNFSFPGDRPHQPLTFPWPCHGS